ncbi:hypothetical protein [Methanogenium cariaci]|uniref:hypothetical protein n=1 Tax=Methanogenium cariaci TaxID=2197 RepID=UPI001FDFD9C8|nr:hypothetical protein [Methanogenium cariaci]
MKKLSKVPDSCLLSFALIGSMIVILTVLALLTITLKQVTDLPYFISVATESKVVDAILLTMVAGLNAVVLLLIFGIPLAYILARTEFRGEGSGGEHR